MKRKLLDCLEMGTYRKGLSLFAGGLTFLCMSLLPHVLTKAKRTSTGVKPCPSQSDSNPGPMVSHLTSQYFFPQTNSLTLIHFLGIVHCNIIISEVSFI